MPNPMPSSETLDSSSYARKFGFIVVCPRYTEVTKIAAQQHIGPWLIWILSEITTYRLRSVIRGVLFPDVARPRWSTNGIKSSGVAAVPIGGGSMIENLAGSLPRSTDQTGLKGGCREPPARSTRLATLPAASTLDHKTIKGRCGC
jgi:hypothetical protein